jgi:hypothetical protein
VRYRLNKHRPGRGTACSDLNLNQNGDGKMKRIVNQLLKRAGSTALAVAVFALTACGGSDGAGNTSGSSTGTTGVVNVGLTDAAGDFVTYSVDVTSLTLTKANGSVVQTLPQKTRVDFAQYADLTEFLTGASVPAGDYVGATLQVDYTNADIEVDNGSGTPVKVAAANLRDGNGNPLATLSMTVKLDNARHLVIAPGIPALLDLDFNLAASNLVDMSTPTAPVVTVNPILVADVNPDLPKPHRIRGPLDSVDTAAGSFTLVLRPFNLLQGDHGRLTFSVDANTQYEINQASYQGSAGLSQLAQQPRFTATVSFGTLVAGGKFLATEVYAGSSVPFGSSDVVTGNVLARNGNVLTVKGATLVRSNGNMIFRDTVNVTVASTTKVTGQALAGTNLDIADISVGQRITVLGTLDNAGANLDASNGLARLLITQLNGLVSSVASGNIVMTLAYIDGRPISLFNFTGTGNGGNDANPSSYQVATGALSLTGITNGTPLKVRGFVQPFGQATASNDFNAITLIDVTHTPANLVVGWPALEAMPFNTYSVNGMVINLTQAGTRHDVYRSGVDTVLALTDTPTVQAVDPLHGLFAIGTNGSVQIYTQLANYQQALQAGLQAGQKARGFFAGGGNYTDATKTLTTRDMLTLLQ